MEELVKAGLGALKEWPLVQAAVAIMVLVFAALLARGALKERAAVPVAQPQATVPVQIESPWLTQQVIETHYEVEQIKNTLNVISSKIDGIAILMRRRQSRKSKN